MLGSAGGPRRALPLLLDRRGRRTFVIVNGDTLTDVDVAAMAAAHAESGAAGDDGAHPEPAAGQVRRRAGRRRRLGHRIHARAAAADGARSTSSACRSSSATCSPALDGRRRRGDGERAVSGADCAGATRRRRVHLATRRSSTSARPRIISTTSLELAAVEGDRIAHRGRARRIDAVRAVVRTVVWDDVTVGAGAELVECIVADGVAHPRRRALSPLRDRSRCRPCAAGRRTSRRRPADPGS